SINVNKQIVLITSIFFTLVCWRIGHIKKDMQLAYPFKSLNIKVMLKVDQDLLIFYHQSLKLDNDFFGLEFLFYFLYFCPSSFIPPLFLIMSNHGEKINS